MVVIIIAMTVVAVVEVATEVELLAALSPSNIRQKEKDRIVLNIIRIHRKLFLFFCSILFMDTNR